MKAKFKILIPEIKKESYKFILNNCAGFYRNDALSPVGDSKKVTFSTFITVSENSVPFGDENLIYFTLFYFLQLFYQYLAVEFFTDINSKRIQFTAFFPKEFVIMGRKTFLARWHTNCGNKF